MGAIASAHILLTPPPQSNSQYVLRVTDEGWGEKAANLLNGVNMKRKANRPAKVAPEPPPSPYSSSKPHLPLKTPPLSSKALVMAPGGSVFCRSQSYAPNPPSPSGSLTHSFSISSHSRNSRVLVVQSPSRGRGVGAKCSDSHPWLLKQANFDGLSLRDFEYGRVIGK